MNEKREVKARKTAYKFTEGVDFYYEKGLMVLTEEFLKKRGYCCENDCRNCPFSKKETYKR